MHRKLYVFPYFRISVSSKEKEEKYSRRNRRNRYSMTKCCKCSAAGTCVNCSCARKKIPCVNCAPGGKCKCKNGGNRLPFTTKVLAGTGTRGPGRNSVAGVSGVSSSSSSSSPSSPSEPCTVALSAAVNESGADMNTTDSATSPDTCQPVPLSACEYEC